MFQPYRVTDVSKKSTLGNLMLTDKGLWSFIHARGSQSAPDFKQGALVAFLPHKPGAPSHLFGVVLSRSWGVIMQRLDGQQVATGDIDGELVPLVHDAQLRRWGICRGTDAEVVGNACLEAGAPTTAWRIFRTDANARLSVATEWGLAAPIRTDGLVHGRRAVVRAEAVKAGWVAVPTRTGSPDVAHARVLLEPDCPELDTSQSLQPLEILRGDASFGTHPADIEAAAIASGADVLVRCTDEVMTIAAPTLYRPLLTVDGSSVRGTPLGAMHPFSISRDPDARQLGQATVFLAAALSTGAVLAADLYLEQALVAAPNDELAARLAVDLMQVPSSAGRPEVAIRAGREASKGAWHRQNSASFVLGTAWALAALGQPRAHVEAMNRVQELAESSERSTDSQQMRLWLSWSGFRDELNTSSNRGKNAAIGYYKDQGLSKWLEAAEILAGWSEARTQSHADTTSGVHKAFSPSPQGCKELQTCKLDVYGRNFASFVDRIGSGDPRRLIDQLSTLSVAALRPGFRLSALDANTFRPEWAVAFRAAAIPLLAPKTRKHGFEALTAEVARAWRQQGTCLEISVADELVGRLDSRRHREGGDPVLAATSWLLSDGLTTACESPAAFVASLEAGLSRQPQLATYAGPLFEALTSKATDNERSMLLRQLADFTAEHEKGSACKRWNLALAVSRANVGQLTEAESDLSRAINCEARGEEAYEETEQLLIAYLRFEKSASLAEDLGTEVRARLEALVRRATGGPDSGSSAGGDKQVCLGLLPLDYRLEHFVHPDVASLAVAMPEPPTDDLELETSSKTVARGAASLVVARRLLGEARPGEAARALGEAHQAFKRIEHIVGLRRVSFLESVVFDGDLDAFLSKEEPESGTELDLSSENPSAADWARALRSGKAREVLDATKNGADVATDHGLKAALAASLLVQSEDLSVELWRGGSGRTSFDTLCR
jgi:hypothetical protein